MPPISSQATSTDYYVAVDGRDSGDGAADHPWATITHASAVARPGATIHVRPGIYSERIVTSAAGTPTHRIRYVSDHRWAAVISPASHGIFSWKNVGDYTDIVGFEIAGSDCIGIGLGGSDQIAQSNNVHNSAENCNNNPKSGAGIDAFDYASRDDSIIANFVHDVGIADPRCGEDGHDFVQGIYQANAGGSIWKNLAVNNCGFGIHLWHGATHARIVNNTVVNNRAGGIVIGSGDAPCTTTGCPGGNDYSVVRNNIVAFNGNSKGDGWGIVESSAAPGQTGLHNQYSHNLSFKNKRGDFSLANGLTCSACIRDRDPGFVSALSGNFHLSETSPAAGTGSKEDSEGTDFDGKTYDARQAHDIGAFAASDDSGVR